MKPSHLTTPRTLGECNFQTGYKSADPDDIAERLLTWFCVATLLVVIPAIAFGVL